MEKLFSAAILASLLFFAFTPEKYISDKEGNMFVP